MATTTIQTIITRARLALNETTARFWTDAELLGLAQEGVEDLWKACKSANQKHFITTTTSTVSASATGITAPDDVGAVYGIEVSSASANPNLHFVKKDYFSPEFQQARFASAIDPTDNVAFYDVFGPGGPASSSSTTIKIAPMFTSAVGVTVYYIPTVGTLTTSSINPIPGHSDNALKAWVVAYARAREREDRAPDSEWLTIYSTEKQNLINSVLEPRDMGEENYVPGMFEQMWPE